MSTTAQKPTTEKEAIAIVENRAFDLMKVPYELRTPAVVKAALASGVHSSIVISIPEDQLNFELVLNGTPKYSSQVEIRDYASRVLKKEWGVTIASFVKLVKSHEIANLDKVTDKDILKLIYTYAVKENISNIRKIPSNLIEDIVTKEIATKALLESGRDYKGIQNFIVFPQGIKEDEDILDLFEIQVIKNAKSIYDFDGVDDKYITQKMYTALIEERPIRLEKVPEERKTADLCRLAVEKDGSTMKFVPKELKPDLYRLAVSTGKGLDSIPEDDKTDILCTIAVEKNPLQLEFVPEDKKAYSLCLSAVDNNCQAIDFVPDSKIDEEMMIRFLTSLMKGNFTDKHELTDEYKYRSTKGKKAIVQKVLDTYLGEGFQDSKRREVLGFLFEKVIERDASLYFKMMKFSTDDDYKYREFNKYFSRVPYFDHAVIAARKDISVVSGFNKEIQELVWKYFINNNK
jgi:hypothetical protein